jgi:hypothetical protein
MPESPLEAAGAAVQPVASAALHTNEFFSGMWTQGNPLGPGAVPYLYQKFYSATRFDRLVGGANLEITTRLTLARRPGASVYNSSLFPSINRFYEWRGFDANGEHIRIMASVDNPSTGQAGGGTVRDVTGPSTNLTIQTKAANAGRTSFVSVGNDLYWGDGAETSMLVQFTTVWTAATQYNSGDMLVDSNGNVQMAMGAQTATIINIQVDDVIVSGGTHVRKVTLFFSGSTPLNILNNVILTLAGLTTVPSLNGATTATVVDGTTKVVFSVVPVGGNPPITPYSTETGTATTGTGISGGTAPAWNATTGGATQDGGNQWINLGPAAQAWGLAAPTIAPTVSQTKAPSIYPAWAANTWYSPNFVILDSNNNLQQLTGPTTGTIKTGNAAPTWATAVGAVTTESGGGANAKWTCLGPSTWQANFAYAVNISILATYTYYITVPVTTYVWNGYTNVPTVTLTQQPVTTTSLFECMTAGTSGPSAPDWTNGVGTTVQDNGVTWKNTGTAPAWMANATLSLTSRVMDSNNNVEVAQTTGVTGATVTWNTGGVGSSTADNNQVWINLGPYSAAGTAPWQWAYSGKDSITGQISTASPLSAPLTLAAGQLPVIQGPGLPNPPYDTIVLWRTMQGGSTLFYDDEFPNPGAGQTWIYTDTNADPGIDGTGKPLPSTAGQINPFIAAPIAGQNNPPPAGFVPQCYYLGRIWGFVGNVLRWSAGPDTVVGNGDQSFPAVNEITFPANGVVCWPTSIGLICYTLGSIWIVLGSGTPSSPFYASMFQEGVALACQDAFAVNGSTAYGMLTSGQVVSMDPGAGELEVGFPIGDQFNALYTPAQTYCAWHQAASADTALYVADGAQGWFRMAAVAAPESGNVWSPRGLMAAPGKVKAIASVETAPGVKALLLGPSVNNQPILFRDATTSQDNGAAYSCFGDMGSIVLCQPGNTVAVQYITTEEKAITGSTPATVAVLFEEIAGTYNTLRNVTNDPPNLPPSVSVTARRAWTSQDESTVQKCRHMRVEISWPAQNYANELLTYTIYGRLPEKARK